MDVKNKTNSVLENKTPQLHNTYGWGIRHLQMLCLGTTLLMLFIARSTISVAVLAMTDQSKKNHTDIMIFSWDKKTRGIIMSSFYWCYILMQIPGSLLAKRFGARPLIMIALIVNGALCLLSPLLSYWGGWPMFCLCRVLMGLTQAPVLSSCHTFIACWFPAHERTIVVGMVYGATKLGIIIALPLSGFLAEMYLGWKLIFYVSGGLLLMTTVIFGSLTASSPSQHWLISQEEREYIEKELTNVKKQKTMTIPWIEIFRCKPFWGIVLCHSAYAIYFSFFMTEIPQYLEKVLEISLKNSALLSSLPFIGMYFGSVFSSTVSMKLLNAGYLSLGAQRKITNSISSFGSSLGLITLCFIEAEHKSFAIFILVTALFLGGFAVAGFLGNHMDLAPNFSGVLYGVSNCVATVWSGAIPIYTALVLQNDPTDTYYWIIVLVSVAVLVSGLNILYMIVASVERQPWDYPDYKKNIDPEEMKPVLEKDKDMMYRHEEL